MARSAPKPVKRKPATAVVKLTYTRSRWIDDAALAAVVKRAEPTSTAPKDFAAFVPTIRPHDADGAEVAVTLCGPRGRDREMILDRADWEDISARLDPRCFIATYGTGKEFFVASMTPDGAVTSLAEHIIGDHQGMKLLHGCRDILDLRRRTMRLVPMWKWVGWESGGNVLPRREVSAQSDV